VNWWLVLLLGRSVMRGSRRLTEVTRSFGVVQGFPPPDNPPSAEFAEFALARLHALAESIEDGMAGDPQDYSRKIRADTESLTGKLDDLVQLSQIQAGTLSLKRRQVGLDDLVSDEVAGLDALAAGRSIRLRAGAIEPASVNVDDRAMTQIINNLLVNAIRRRSEPDNQPPQRSPLR
jgi:signal transduction histidine kinase